MMMMDNRKIVGLLVLISGLAFVAVSLWMLVDTVKFAGIDAGTTDSPKVGMAAGVIAAVVGFGCFVVKNLESMKNLLLGVILVLLILAIATFALAIKEYTNIKRSEEALDLFKRLQVTDGNFPGSSIKGSAEKDVFGNINFSGIQDINPFLSIYEKLKPQLIVLIVAGVIACLLQIIALVFVFKIQSPQSSRTAMQLGRPH